MGCRSNRRQATSSPYKRTQRISYLPGKTRAPQGPLSLHTWPGRLFGSLNWRLLPHWSWQTAGAYPVAMMARSAAHTAAKRFLGIMPCCALRGSGVMGLVAPEVQAVAAAVAAAAAQDTDGDTPAALQLTAKRFQPNRAAASRSARAAQIPLTVGRSPAVSRVVKRM